MISWCTRKRSEGSEYELPDGRLSDAWRKHHSTGRFISPVSVSLKSSCSLFMFLTINTRLLFGGKLKRGRGEAKDVLVKGCKVWNNACTHTEAYARSHSGCFMKSFSFTLPEQLRGTRTRQTKKEGKQNKKIWIRILVWGKRGQLWRDLERGLICQISFRSRSCGACLSGRSMLAAVWRRGAQHGENRSPQHSPEAADTHQSESPSAMTWRHLSGDLDWLVPKTSRPPQMSPNQF